MFLKHDTDFQTPQKAIYSVGNATDLRHAKLELVENLSFFETVVLGYSFTIDLFAASEWKFGLISFVLLDNRKF